MRGAIDQYFADKGAYPSELGNLVSEDYLRSIPMDPLTGSTETWQIVLADFDPLSSFSQQIYDVKSASEEVALDGSIYADW
jgi:general secretion pathway protein G